jgi:hypothetical protein
VKKFCGEEKRLCVKKEWRKREDFLRGREEALCEEGVEEERRLSEGKRRGSV